MPPRIVSRAECLAARQAQLKNEKALTPPTGPIVSTVNPEALADG